MLAGQLRGQVDLLLPRRFAGAIEEDKAGTHGRAIGRCVFPVRSNPQGRCNACSRASRFGAECQLDRPNRVA